jgi:hypothetical protein
MASKSSKLTAAGAAAKKRTNQVRSLAICRGDTGDVHIDRTSSS